MKKHMYLANTENELLYSGILNTKKKKFHDILISCTIM